MSVSKYKFVSPGVFIKEVDRSKVAVPAPDRGPIIIGRTERGPAMRPIQVNSFSEYIELFGDTVPGGKSGDVWRDGNYTSPMYATYAAQAWLRNGQTATVLRLLGAQNTNQDGTSAAKAGWGGYTRATTGGAAYGLFLLDQGQDLAAGATQTITALSKTSGQANTRKLKVYDIEGNNVEFTIDNSTDTSTATVIAFSNANSNATQFATNIAAAINAADTANTLNVSATSAAAVVTLTMTTKGVRGAGASDTSGTAVSDSVVTMTAQWTGGTDGHYSADHSGSLAAVWYFPNTDYSIMLSGALRGASYIGLPRANQSNYVTGAAVFVEPSSGKRDEYTAIIANDGTHKETFTFNFDPDSDKFIRKVFNTNPIMTNSTLVGSSATGSLKKYWLGHSFEGQITSTNTLHPPSQSAATHGVILGLGNAASGGGISVDWSAFKIDAATAKSGWIISQDLRGSNYADFDPATTNQVEKLFQFHSLDLGEWANRQIKVSIANIAVSPNADVDEYGTFDVLVRRSSDSDSRMQVLERYSNCNLNPNSPNYIARRIGDTYTQWDDVERRFRSYGDYVNVSKFIRVDVNTDATDPRYLPFGFWGPYRPKTFTIQAQDLHQSGTIQSTSFATTASMPNMSTGSQLSSAPIWLRTGVKMASSSFEYPKIRLRVSSSDSSLTTDRAAYFGYDSLRENTRRFDRANIDVLRMLPSNLTPDDGTDGSNVEISLAFTLDDLKITPGTMISEEKGEATYSSGSRAAGTSATAETGSYQCIIDAHGFDKFTVPMWGGSDGWDITEMDPVANRILSGKSEKTSYAFNTIRRAIDAAADPERVDYSLLTAPGVTNTTLTDLMVDVCEDRGDSLALVDLPDVYLGPAEASSAEQYKSFPNRLGTVDSVVSAFKTRKKNSSYGATYYPWVQVRDSINDALVWVPPSVVALGTFAHSDRVGELWFAPAGFNRGGLSQGSSGLTVTNISERLSSEQRDKLYEANINPIASFPNEGIVIFGQKTMDASTSALSRINVRRLLIFLKKEVSRRANQVLFDQNLDATWSRFKGLVIPLLESVKTKFGLTDYKLVLDETTTTPDLIDRNVMYAKIFLKPARAIEFIALDFIITRTGASFDD